MKEEKILQVHLSLAVFQDISAVPVNLKCEMNQVYEDGSFISYDFLS